MKFNNNKTSSGKNNFRRNNSCDTDFKQDSEQDSEATENIIFPDIKKNLDYIKNVTGDAVGLVENSYDIFGGKVKAGVAFIEVIADKELISRHVIIPLIESNAAISKHAGEILSMIQTGIIPATKTYITDDMQQVVNALYSGDTAFFLENLEKALIVGSSKFPKRAIEKPENEATVLGSQDSFTDDLDTNVGLIIKRLPMKKLHFESFTTGRLSRTKTKLVWLDGIANPKIIEDVKKRIKSIDSDIVDGLGILAELIEDKPQSIFPKYRQTERPDVAVRSLSTGCFAIILDTSPFAIVAPYTLWDNFKTMDDYEERSSTSTYLRIVRYAAFLISVLATPLYLAFVTYNHAVVPPSLAINIAQGREGVPFPTVVEVMLMSLSMSIIREAGLRMPGSVGYFIGTLAAVLIGQAIVTAGYVSASLIIVIAVSTIASFAISAVTLLYSSRLLNYFFILLAGLFGIFGLINGFIFMFWHLLSLRSFGLPYLYPVIPFDPEQWKDTFVRAHYKNLKRRSRILAPFNREKAGRKINKPGNGRKRGG